ncbi:MAG TPA: MlaD family protein, partial [candidate division Zixibacteria bacterium]|nr:MlaD family protein [candidate division Zixibacteria bacterium]
MRSTVGVKWGGLKVGILIMLAILVLLWASLSGGGTSIFSAKFTYHSYFKNVSGMVAGAPVWMAGVEVGNVRRIEFVNLDSLRRVLITFTVKESVHKMVTSDARVQLGTIGFLGDKYLEVIPGGIGGPVLPEGSLIPPQDVGSAEAVFAAAENAIGEAEALAANLDTLLARANAGVGTLGMLATNQELYVQMTRLASEMADLARGLQANQKELLTSVTRAANTMADVGEKLDDSTG